MRVAVIAALLAHSAAAQTEPTIRSETRVVQIDVVVKDSGGRIVQGLSRDDFLVKDEGKPRAIQIFSVNRGEPAVEAPAAPRPLPPGVFSNLVADSQAQSPHATVILFDVLNDYFDNFARTRAQIISMIGRLRRDERVAIYVLTMYQGLLILQDYTTDHDLLIRKLSAYVAPGMVAAPVGSGGVGRAESSSSGPAQPAAEKNHFMRVASESTRNAIQAIANHMAIVPGRKSLVWISQGFPPRLIREYSDAWSKTLDVVNQSNVQLDTVDANGLMGPPRRWGPGGLASLQELAERTGGRAFYNRNDLDAGMLAAIEEKRTSYTLGFYLADDERDGKFHRLSVQVNRPHLDLHYRQGYIAGTDRRMEREQKKAEIESALLSPLDSTGVGITMAIQVVPGKPRATLRIRTVLDPATISLQQKPNGWAGKFDQLFVEMDAEGRPIARIADTRQFQVNPAQYQRFQREGLVYTQSIPLEAGAATVHVILRDSETGHIGSLKISIPNLANERRP